jgi:tetratricopeptide (TPR) repeat protein
VRRSLRVSRRAAVALFAALVVALAGLPPAVVFAEVTPVGLPDASDHWIRLQAPHFVIFSDAPTELTLDMARQIETFRAALLRLGTGLEARSPVPTVVFIFKDHETYRPYRLRSDIAGFFVKHRDGNSIAVNAGSPGDPWQVVFHEYLHFFLNNNFTDIPLWLDEGMAEAYCTFTLKGTAARLGEPLDTHREWLADHPLMPLEALFAIDTGSKDYQEGARQGTFYAQSWALVHQLMFGGSGDGTEFLRSLKRGGSLREYVQPKLGRDPSQLFERLKAYVKADKYPEKVLDLGTLEAVDLPDPAPLARAELLYRLGDYLLHLDASRMKQAERHLREAVSLDPRHGPAWAALGQLEHQRGRFKEASALFDKALGLAPDDPSIALLYAYSLVERTFPPGVVVRRAVGDVPKALTQARDLFKRALKDSPDIVEAWAGLGSTYAFDSGNLGPGVAALEKALTLAPGRVDVAVDLAELYVRSGKRQRAEDLIERIVRHSSDPEQRAAGQAVLLRADVAEAQDRVQKGDIEGGLAALRKLRAGAPSPEERKEIDGILSDLERTSTSNRYVSLFNDAVAKFNAHDLDGAIALLDQVARECPDPGLAKEAATRLATARRAQAEERHIGWYNDAVEKYRRKDFKGAAALLHKVLDDTPEARIETAARDLLSKVRAAAPGVK